MSTDIQSKGIILRSAVTDNVKVVLALFDDGTEEKLLVKPLVTRRDKTGKFTTNQPFKHWLYAQEVRALIVCLERAAFLLDEKAEGVWNPRDILEEDEDARLFVASDPVMYPSIENMFDMNPVIEKEQEDDS